MVAFIYALTYWPNNIGLSTPSNNLSKPVQENYNILEQTQIGCMQPDIAAHAT